MRFLYLDLIQQSNIRSRSRSDPAKQYFFSSVFISIEQSSIFSYAIHYSLLDDLHRNVRSQQKG